MVLPLCYQLTQVVSENRPLNGCFKLCVFALFAFSALTLLVWRQEGHPASKN